MPLLSRDLDEAMKRCAASAAERGRERPTLQDLLLALSESEEGGALLDACAVDRARLRVGLELCLDTDPMASASTTEVPLPDDVARVVRAPPVDDVARVMQRAAIHCHSAGRAVIHGENVIIALFSERRSPAVALLEAQGMTRLDALRFITEGTRKNGAGGETS